MKFLSEICWNKVLSGNFHFFFFFRIEISSRNVISGAECIFRGAFLVMIIFLQSLSQIEAKIGFWVKSRPKSLFVSSWRRNHFSSQKFPQSLSVRNFRLEINIVLNWRAKHFCVKILTQNCSSIFKVISIFDWAIIFENTYFINLLIINIFLVSKIFAKNSFPTLPVSHSTF